MRALVVALVLATTLSGCARVFGRSDGSDAVQSVPVSVDSILRVAATQLRHHGYEVTPAGDNGLVTAPRAVPEWLGGKDAAMKDRQWFVQINAEPHFLARGTRLEVMGYLVPESASKMITGTTPSVQNAVPVTSRHALYQEVRSIAGWIGDAARRK